MKRVAVAIFLVACTIQGALGQDAPETGDAAALSPTEVVDSLHAGLLDIMQRAGELGFAGRRDVIGPIVDSTFDTEVLSASAIGLPIWRTWSDEQKQEYQSVFQRFLTANYAYQFDAYSGQSFEVISNDDGPKDTTLVKSHLVRPNKDAVELIYLTRVRRGKVGIIDVFSDGSVSEAARRRSEFSTIFRDSGFTGLISSIESQISDLESGTPAPEAG